VTITTEQDFDTGRFILMVTCRAQPPMPAGPRLFRAPPYPEMKWQCETAEEAETYAARMRAYLAALPERKQSKRELREVGA
jgi:hypothetical protein